jgi:hypothetical protein
MVFDSTNLAWNAVADLDTLPYPSRYTSGNYIGYLDTHVRSHRAAYTGEIR